MTILLSDAPQGLACSVISRVAFASCYVYSPAGTDFVCQRSRLLRSLLKEGHAYFMVKYALRVHEQAAGASLLAGFFQENDVLIPVPGSEPKGGGRKWVAASLADALVREGLACSSWPGLRRVRPVHKSATAPPGKRPSVEIHFDSFSIDTPLEPPRSIVLIDDVVTKGRTMLAAASRLHQEFPTARIRAFALLRTMGLTPNVKKLLDPCRGEIRWVHGDARRRP